MAKNFRPHLHRAKLHPRPRLKAFPLKGFDIISESDLIIRSTAIIFSHNRWYAFFHYLTEVIHGDALLHRSGPSFNAPGMGTLEV